MGSKSKDHLRRLGRRVEGAVEVKGGVTDESL